jgi:integration host factor subunit beta
MIKSELIDAIAARATLRRARAKLVVDCLFEAMADALGAGQVVIARRFGTFSVRPYRPYRGFNPRDGSAVDVPAKRLQFFRVGKEVREIVNDGRSNPIMRRRQVQAPLRRTDMAMADAKERSNGGGLEAEHPVAG